jgi:hypothetical protein
MEFEWNGRRFILVLGDGVWMDTPWLWEMIAYCLLVQIYDEWVYGDEMAAHWIFLILIFPWERCVGW